MRSRHFMALAAAAVLGSGTNLFADLLWNNGPLSTGTTTRSGVAAPAGSEWSELAEGNTSAGASTHITGVTGAFRLADDFTLSVGSNLTSLTAHAYTTGSAASAVYTVGNIQIWSGRPGDIGSTVLFGDTTTDRLISSAATNLLRSFGTTAAAGGTPSVPDSTRIIKSAVFDLAGLTLAPGTYWADYQITPLTTGGTVFHPTTTYATRNLITDNARQFATTALWADLLDTGNPATLPDVPLDLAFRVDGTRVPEPVTGSLLALAGLSLRRRRR